MDNENRKVVLVTRKTRLEELIARFHTEAQARFYIEHASEDGQDKFRDYQVEQQAYTTAKNIVLDVLNLYQRKQVIDRAYLPNFLFDKSDVVITLGQDGMVANTLKYLDGQPLIGINPDETRYDGILLPFSAKDLKRVLMDTVQNKRDSKTVSMAEARLNDGQSMLAVNDLFIGASTHVSARYEISYQGVLENQSSSGIIVSTGLGSTGWMNSIVTSAASIAQSLSGKAIDVQQERLPWDANQLAFAVREPFPSRFTQNTIVFGRVSNQKPLVISSKMPENAVIFSDGVESDYIAFNAGAIATIGIAEKVGQLVI